MSFGTAVWIGAGAVAAYAALVLVLVAAGRGADARALAGFVPDCVVLLRRLLSDRRLARSAKVLLGALLVYLVLPFDLVPDFVPVAGQLDDALIAAIALRRVVRTAGEPLIREHWPGPARSLALVLRLAGV